MISPTKPGKIEDIQVLRAIAILLVLGQHLDISFFILDRLLPGRFVPFWSGVSLFFVISGYVVTATLLDRPLAPVSFLIRRAFRLLPAMLCFLAFSGAVAAAIWIAPVHGYAGEHFGADLKTFMREAINILAGTVTPLLGGTKLQINGAMWSLSVEFEFYYTYTILLFVLMVIKLPLRATVLIVAITLYLSCLAMRLTSYNISWLPGFIRYLTAWSFDSLFLGVIGAAGLRPLISADRLRFGSVLAVALLVVSQAVLVADPPFGPGMSPASLLHRVAMPMAGLCFLAVVLLASVNRAFIGQGSRFYELMVWIGELSYSIYLFHFPVFALVALGGDVIYPRLFQIGYPGLMQLDVTLPLIFALALVVYLYVEKPMNELGARLAARVPARLTGSAVVTSPG